MTRAEAAIGTRIRQFREQVNWSQPALASELGISRDQIQGVEYGRVPLRYGLASRLCARCHLSQLWLAEGTGRPHPQIPVPEGVEARIPERMLFSEAFAKHIKPAIGEAALKWTRAGVKIVFLDPPGLPPDRVHHWRLSKELQSQLEVVPLKKRSEFCQAVIEAAATFLRDNDLEYRPTGLYKPPGWPVEKPVPVNVQTIALTETSDFGIMSAMQFEMGWILKEVKRRTKLPGQQTALAKKLDIPQSRLSEWLNGKCNPNGRQTLQLIQWLLGCSQAKKDTPGSVSPAPGEGTKQVRSKPNEKHPSG